MNLTSRPHSLRPFVRFVLAACWSTVVIAAGVGEPGMERRAARAESLDLQASRVYVFVGKVGFGHEHGVVGTIKSGRLELGVEGNAGERDAGEIVFDMTTFAADTPEARRYVGLAGVTAESTRREVDANLRGPDVLDVRRHPTALFAVRSSRPLRDARRPDRRAYRLAGDFTLHGTTRPVVVDVVAQPAEAGVRVAGSFKILQSDYGIKPFSKAFGAVGVTDELTIYGDVLLVPTGDATRRPAEAGAVGRPASPRR